VVAEGRGKGGGPREEEEEEEEGGEKHGREGREGILWWKNSSSSGAVEQWSSGAVERGLKFCSTDRHYKRGHTKEDTQKRMNEESSGVEGDLKDGPRVSWRVRGKRTARGMIGGGGVDSAGETRMNRAGLVVWRGWEGVEEK